MKMMDSVKRVWALALVVAIASYGVSVPALADLVPTRQLLADQQLETGREQVRNLLQQERVTSMLTDMGVDVDAAGERVSNLSAAELEMLAQQIDTLPAGEGALGTIALVLVILILLDVAGVTDIFPAV